MVRTKLTYDDLIRLPDDGLRHELIDGEHYVSPAPAFDHQAVVVNLTREISIFLRSFDERGTVLPPPDVLTTLLLPGFELPLAQVFDCEPHM